MKGPNQLRSRLPSLADGRTGTLFSGVRRAAAIVIALLLISVGLPGRAAAAAVTVAVNFEGIDSIPWTPIPDSSQKKYTDAEGGVLHLLPRSPYLPTINKRAAVDGSQSMCISVGVPGAHDRDSDRSEVAVMGQGADHMRVNDEFWYSFNVRPDPNLKPNAIDPDRPSGRLTDVVFQIHNTQSPALSGPPMVVQTDGLNWHFNVRGSSDPAQGYNADAQGFPLGPVQLGQWTNFIMNVKYNTNGQGWLRVWVNGTLMFNKRVSNTYPDATSTSRGAFAKFGVYSWWLEYPHLQRAGLDAGVMSRDFCHDRVRVADAGSSCQMLAPEVQCDPVPSTFGYQWNGSTPIKPGPPDTHAAVEYHPVRTATASHFIAGQPPANAVDGNPSTYWSTDVSGAELVLDLGSVKPVSKVHIAWIRGDTRRHTFQILAGDGTTRYDTGRITSTGSTTGLEAYEVPFNARWIRIVGYGNSVNAFNSIAEVKVSR